MTRSDSYRRVFGLSAALILIVILVARWASFVGVDDVALGLLAGVAASVAFAFADGLGIAKISTGAAGFEFAERAADAIQGDQRGKVDEVLKRNQNVFPVVGARVLWVDNHPEKLVAHRQVLRRLGIQVISATSTNEAIPELERDPDFALLIQDRIRPGGTDDAKKFAKWVKEAKAKGNLVAPLVVYSFDSFDASIGVPQEDWITKDFSRLLSRVAMELRSWSVRFPDPQGKSPA